MKKLRKVNPGFDRFSGVYLWVVFVIIFSIWSPHEFATLSTVKIIASQQTAGAVVAVALLIPMVCGQFDLTVGSNANLSGLVAILLQDSYHWAPVPAIIAAVLIGAVIGVVNGFIVVKLHVNSFIATLAVGSVIMAAQTVVTNSATPAPPTSVFWSTFTQNTIGGFQIVTVYLIVIALVVWVVLVKTPAGRYMHATGSNPEAARLSGIQTDRWSWLSLIASGAIAAFAGVLYVSLTGPSDDFGSNLLLPAFAAVFLGATQLVPGRFNVWGTLLAIVVLATGVTGLQLVTTVQWLPDLFNGVALVVAVSLSVSRVRTFGSRGTKGRSSPASEDPAEPKESSGSVPAG